MRYLVFFFAVALAAQTCSHNLKYAPVGPILLYRNGILLQEGSDFSTANVPGTNRCCVVTPLAFGNGDLMSVVITRAVALSLTVNGQPVPYLAYGLWRTDWNCSGSQGQAELLLKLDPVVVPGLQHATSFTGREYYLVDWPPK